MVERVPPEPSERDEASVIVDTTDIGFGDDVGSLPAELGYVQELPVDKVMIDSPAGDVRLGQIILIVFFVGFIGWAALVRVDAAVYAGGSIIVSGQRQQLQHREGGVVTNLSVKEGDRVVKDQVLLQLSGGQSQANAGAFKAEYITLKVQEARLLAEAAGAQDFLEPVEFKGYNSTDRATVLQAMQIQRQALSARRQALSAQVSVLRQQQLQTKRSVAGSAEQLAANQRRRQLLQEELSGVEALEAKGYAPKTRVRVIQQNIAGIDGENAALKADISGGGAAVGESRMREVTLQRQTQQDVVLELRETQSKLSEIVPQLTAAETEFGRTELRAPATGKVVGLTTFTVGGVIQPGQKILDIVPENAPLIIEANVDARDGDDIRTGMEATIRYSALHERNLPTMKGRVLEVSADSFQDEKTGRVFYRAQIEVSPQSIALINKVRDSSDVLKPGLPVDVIIPLRKRTILDYLLEPLLQTFWRSFREN